MKRLLLTGFLLFSANAILAQDLPKQINGGILNGKAISLPKPVYSEQARSERLEGTVRIDVLINEEGEVVSAEPATGLIDVYRPGGSGLPEKEAANTADPVLIESARDAAMLAKFSPTYLNGVGVKIKGTIVYRFAAEGSEQKDDSVKGGVLNGKAVSLPNPEYPAAAKAVKARGAISVQILIDEGGNVIRAEAISGHPLLRAAAVDAARGAQFSPTVMNGSVVKVSGVLTYNFVP